jgi:amino acid transporter
MQVQGYKLDDLPFRAVLGIYGSYIGLSMNVLCIVAQTYVAIAPITGTINANEFFQNMLALPIILALFVFWKFYQGTSYVRASEMDLVTGRRELDLAALKQQEMAEREGWPMWKK